MAKPKRRKATPAKASPAASVAKKLKKAKKSGVSSEMVAVPAPPPAPKPALVSAEMIKSRAYELFLARGGVRGTPMRDWLQAEQELQKGRP